MTVGRRPWMLREPLRGARRVIAMAGERRAHASEVAMLERAPWDDPAALDALRLRRLADSVDRARRRSPYYARTLADVPTPHSFDELSALPLSSKQGILDSGLPRTAPGTPLTRSTWGTSGSSGEPYRFGIDLGYPARHAAQRAFVYRRAGLPAGSRVVELIGGWPAHRRPDPRYTTFERIRVDDHDPDAIDAVLRPDPHLVFADASELRRIADHVDRSGRPPSLCMVASSSEVLLPADRARLEASFGVPVIDVYGSAEAGNLAYRGPGDERWTVLSPRVVVELVDGDGRPVDDGEVGEIVVTTLTERVAPLVRYATGDLARAAGGRADGRAAVHLEQLDGRVSDTVVDHLGRPVPFWRLADDRFWSTDRIGAHVRRWQIHQAADRSIVVTLQPRGESAAAVADDVVHHVRELVGPGPVRVEEDHRLGESGRRKFRPVTSHVRLEAPPRRGDER